MKILGLDPGLAILGWGVLKVEPSHRCTAAGYGVITTNPGPPLVERLSQMARRLKELVTKEQPTAAAVEELFFAKDSRTAASVGHARGVILYVLNELDVPVFEYNPRQVKMALTGFGGADKEQMQKMVQRLLRLDAIPKPDDAADALAIAFCHIHTFKHPSPARSERLEKALKLAAAGKPNKGLKNRLKMAQGEIAG